MVKHIILWNLKDEYSEEQKEQIRKGIKEGLEGLSRSCADWPFLRQHLPSK